MTKGYSVEFNGFLCPITNDILEKYKKQLHDFLEEDFCYENFFILENDGTLSVIEPDKLLPQSEIEYEMKNEEIHDLNEDYNIFSDSINDWTIFIDMLKSLNRLDLARIHFGEENVEEEYDGMIYKIFDSYFDKIYENAYENNDFDNLTYKVLLEISKDYGWLISKEEIDNCINDFIKNGNYRYNEPDYYDDEPDYYDDEPDYYDDDNLLEGRFYCICKVDTTSLQKFNNGDYIIFENDVHQQQKFYVLDKENGLLITDSFLMDIPKDENIYFGSQLYEIIKKYEDKICKLLRKLGAKNIELPISKKNKELFKLDDAANTCPKSTFNQLITGETGCGKTYKAINDEIDAGRKFIYIAPCRQLVYESYRYYANPENDMLTSGEVKINTEKDGNIFAVYESASEKMLENVDTLIIDEAHFVEDEERGQHLLNLIALAREHNVNIKLLTATQNFELNDFEHIHLKAITKVPAKKEISYEQARQNIKDGMQTIWFAGSIADAEYIAYELQQQGIKAAAMTSKMLPSERLQTQIDFENGDLQVVVSTNVLAQGVNFTCQNLIIEDDLFNTPELLQQKLGRLGRPGTLKDVDEVYYATLERIKDIEKRKTIKKVIKGETDREYIQNALNACIESLGEGYPPSYNQLKYCIPELKKELLEMLENENLRDSMKEDILYTLNLIQVEQEKVKELILNNMRKKVVLKEVQNDKINEQKKFFDLIENAVKKGQDYITVKNVKIHFKKIPCSDLIEINNCIIDIKNKKMVEFNEKSKNDIITSLIQTK